LRLLGSHAAGDPGAPPVTKGCAVKIMTGTPIPEGADAVIPVEDTALLPAVASTSSGAGEVFVSTAKSVKRHANIRFGGEDVVAGEQVLAAGTVLGPPEISMLASCGKILIPVFRRARVAIVSTGDELVEPGAQVNFGKVIDSNSLSLAAAVRETGAVPVVLGIARDDRESLKSKLSAGLEADALITSAGVSVGDRDLVRDILEELGVRSVFWKIEVKPGRPTAFGLKDGKPVFSLPGNPVSGLLIFEEFVRPALLKMMGRRKFTEPLVRAVLKERFVKKAGRVQLLRVAVEVEDGMYAARLSGAQSSGILKSMVQADGVAVLPADSTVLEAGDTVRIRLFRRHVFTL
jgi:molybdopterin molybdotransferase